MFLFYIKLCFKFWHNLKENIFDERTIVFLTVDDSIEHISEKQGMHGVWIKESNFIRFSAIQKQNPPKQQKDLTCLQCKNA